MSTHAPSGISDDELNSAIDSLRSEMQSEIKSVHSEMRDEIRDLQRWVESEVQRLEDEMREVGEMIVNAINNQTVAVVGGVAATTTMLERTKQQIEEDFQATRGRIEVQTESTLQIEIGKKVAVATALKGKLEAFFQDIRTRYDRSLVSVGLNYELYNQNFQKIADDYQTKLHTIGEHIFRIKLEDIAPAVKAARVPYEDAHSLPIEMDLTRLSARSANLDDTLTLLKTSRLDEVTHSLDDLDQTINTYTHDGLACRQGDDTLCVQGLAISSGNNLTVLSGHAALKVQGEQPVLLQVADDSLVAFHSKAAQQRITQQVHQHTYRAPKPDEVVRLGKAAESLAKQNLISTEALALFEDFLGSGKLSVLEK
ncbi:hypothetical protein FJY94_07815 [Candidatus Kaiserbacteria bacterium]|nr:hypothetical protein [Candidatus Kaiserbacteria bacterium]